MREFLHRVYDRYRYPAIILRAMVVSDLKLRYQASFLGYLWTLLRPLAEFAILYVVFARFLRFTGGPNWAICLLLGTVLWGFFGELTGQGLTSIVARGSLLCKVNFPRYVVVLSVTASVAISFVLNMLVIAIFVIASRVAASVEMLWFFLLFLELVTLTVAVTLFLSAFYVRLRDIDYIWQVFTRAAFFGTPIIYSLSLVPEKWARILALNPMAQIIADARHVLVSAEYLTMADLWGTEWIRVVPIGITLVLAVGSIIFFRRRSRTFAEEA